MYQRFTDRARRVLVLAQQEAGLLHHNFIGTEHLLLGLISEQDGVAAQALRSQGVELDLARQRVVETIGPTASQPSGAPPFTPRAKKVLELSLREALQLGHNYIGIEHILLGLIREGEGVAAQVLISLGVELSTLRLQVLDLIESSSAGGEVAPGQGRAASSISPPYCPICRRRLREEIRHARLAVTGSSAGDPVIEVTAVYCLACGHTLGILPVTD